MLNLPGLSDTTRDSQPKMTKKASIFKALGEYFRGHFGATLAWIWVAIMPGIGSLILLSKSQILDGVRLLHPFDHFIFAAAIAGFLGLALLPTTLTALATGYYFGWIGFPGLFFGYLCANVIGYFLGKATNADFLALIYYRKPELRQQIDSRIQHPESLIFFVRISPVIPFAISNFLFASLRIDLKKVLLYGIPGMLPRTLIAFATGLVAGSMLDARKAMGDPTQWAVLAVLFLISFWGLYRNWRSSKS
jgi:uncharacterized membrane protein YdjX (TVP38/TMEM64 family)